MPALPSWLTEPLWDQFAPLLPERPAYEPSHPLGCHRPRIKDRIIFNKIIEILVFGCGYRKAADETCSATAIRDRRDQWVELGVFERLELIALESAGRVAHQPATAQKTQSTDSHASRKTQANTLGTKGTQ